MAPSYPIVRDSDLEVSKLYGMFIASTANDPGKGTPADNQTVTCSLSILRKRFDSFWFTR